MAGWQCSYLTGCLALQIVLVRGLSTWTYVDGPAGPAKWGGECITGRSQSPVNLEPNTSLSSIPVQMWWFSFSYRYQIPCIITNDGNTLKFSFIASKPTTITGGGLNGDFVLSHGLVHWGWNDQEGSEHKVRGQAFPLEIQLVHFNSVYRSYEQAVGKTDGLAVLSVLHELSDTDNEKLSPLVNSLDQVIKPGKSYTIEREMDPRSLLPIIASPLYRYTGSLTAPPCTEHVRWTVFYHTNTVSAAQLAKLRSLLRTGGQNMVHTFRQPVELYTRRVIIASAYLAETITPTTSTEMIITKKEFLQQRLKSEEPSWYDKPAPMWTAVVGGMLLLAAGIIGAIAGVKRLLSTHQLIPTNEIELE